MQSGNKNAVIKFDSTEFTFGKLEINENATCSFSFINKGDSPLLIYRVETTCGCTVPEWPEKPLPEGSKNEIIVWYDTSRPEVFSKSIFVHYNGQDSPVKLVIKGEVVIGSN